MFRKIFWFYLHLVCRIPSSSEFVCCLPLAAANRAFPLVTWTFREWCCHSMMGWRSITEIGVWLCYLLLDWQIAHGSEDKIGMLRISAHTSVLPWIFPLSTAISWCCSDSMSNIIQILQAGGSVWPVLTWMRLCWACWLPLFWPWRPEFITVLVTVRMFCLECSFYLFLLWEFGLFYTGYCSPWWGCWVWYP